MNRARGWVRGRSWRSRLVALLLGFTATLALLSCSRLAVGPNDDRWRLLPGRVEPISFQQFRSGRQCWVYLPPGYNLSTMRYPVLYITDGEVVFDAPGAMHVNRICEDLIHSGAIEPIIVVAIAHVSSADRYLDLTPWPEPAESSPTGGGDAFLTAIRDTLMPAINSKYRTLRDPQKTAIAGMSLGGELAAYAGYAHSEIFGLVGAMSPAYWFGIPTMLAYANGRSRPTGLRKFYQDTGSPEDNPIDLMAQIALQQGFVLGKDFMSVTAEGGEHTPRAWEHRFPGMLMFLYGR